MNSAVNFQKIKTIEVLPASILEAEKPKDPEFIHVSYPGLPLRFPTFQYCYLEREALSNGQLPHEKTRDFRVAPESLCAKRKQIVAGWIQGILCGECSLATSRKIGQVFDWIDKNSLNNLLYTEEDLKRLYAQHTNYLIGRVLKKIDSPESSGGMNPIPAGSLQRALQLIIEYSINVSRKISRSWAPLVCPSYFDSWYLKYDHIEPVVLNVGQDLPQQTKITPEYTQLRFGSPNRVVNVFNFCYLDRASLANGNQSKSHKAQFSVTSSSLSEKRCVVVQ